jgi:DeoR/GlpR family transcriptional regulator of sugar metabolism
MRPPEEQMLAQERRDAILNALVRSSQARVDRLAATLEVSATTIRRDLRHLDREGLIEKVRGGAILPRRISREPHFVAARRMNSGAKTAIALAAVQFVKERTTIGLSAGTTTWLVALHLRDFRELGFVTNSMNVALVLENGGSDSIIVAGGHFRTPSDALVGPLAEQTLRRLHTDLLFIGAHSIDATAGLTTPNISEAETNRVLIANAQQVIAVADSSKLGRVALASFAALEDIDVLITDSGAAPETLDQIGAAVPELVIVESSSRVENQPPDDNFR